jgi:hypothetical protein
VDLPRPEVTVTDPRQPGALVAVEEPPPPQLGRRGAALLGAAALVLVAALVTTDVVRDRRLDGVVDVVLGAPGGGWSAAYDPSSRTGTVTAPVRLLNRGPRDVRVRSAALGELRYDAGAVLPSRDAGTVVWLQQTINCPEDGGPPPVEREPRALQVRLETRAGARQVTLEGSGLPIGSFNESVQTACAYPPLDESLQLASTVLRLEDRAAVLRVEVANDGRRPVRLLSLIPARGLSVLTTDGADDRFPIVLPPQTGRRPVVRTLEVRLGVLCSALRGSDLLTPFEQLSAIVEAEDRSRITSVEQVANDPEGQLRQLAERTCPFT